MDSNHSDVTRMMSVIQESVKLNFACKSQEFTGLREDFLIFFVIFKTAILAAILSAFLFYFLYGYRLSIFN